METSNVKIELSHKIMLVIFIAVLMWSAIKPHSFITWLLEALPAIIIGLIVIFTYKEFKFSTFVYLVILIHAIILLIGSKYTYERNLFFNYLQQVFDLNRNYYDRVGHFAQGFTPALVAKEFLLRKGYLKKSKMFYFIVMCIVLAISAFYELIEFSAVIISGVPGEEILSTQGSEWDTQMDMVMALLGGVTSLTIFKKAHDRSIKKADEK